MGVSEVRKEIWYTEGVGTVKERTVVTLVGFSWCVKIYSD